MPFLAIAGTVASLAVGAAQAIKGNKQRKAAENAAENYLYPALKNQAVGLATPQMAYNEGMRQIAQEEANAYSNLALAGSRGMQMAGNVMSNAIVSEQRLLAQQEKSLYDMALEIAKENMAIRNIQEQRSVQEMQGMASQINAANQTIASGIQNTITGITGLSGMIGNGKGNAVTIKDFSQEPAQLNAPKFGL